MDRLTLILDNLSALGKRKLAALGLTFLLVVGLVSAVAYYLSRPNFELLYAGLDREDVSRIGAALKSSGVAFDVNPEGNAVSVPYGQTSQARMLLAERGLPQSANAGYELFDKVGALGLTSFMQEVTRVRALEGELARTIQLIRGVKAARVHIVLPDEGSFRRAKQPPSASVIIRTEGPDDSSAAQAIRHLVASSLPGMNVDQVTVLNTDGMILSSSDGDANDAVPVKTLALEKSISKDIQDNIRRTLTPYLKLANFQVSVRTRVNTDRKQTNETIFDPESRVERSVRTVKESAQSQNNSGAGQSTSVDRNIPQGGANAGSDAKQSNDESKKSEELTNFELSSKTVTTVSGGYNIEHLSVAVLINRAAFAEPNKEAPKPEAIEKQIKEIEQLVSSAAGLKKERGDALKVTAVDFTFNEREMAPVESQSFMTTLGNHLGSFINALTAIGIAAVVVGFGLAPARRALLAEQPATLAGGQDGESSPMISSEPAPLAIEPAFDPMASAMLGLPEEGGFAMPGFFDGVGEPPKDAARRKLERLIEQDDAHAAAIMKQWMRS